MPEFPATASCFLALEAPLRIGSHADDIGRAQPFPSSDSLFGALAWAKAQLCGSDDMDAWIGRFVAGDPPFLISSAMPATESMLTLVPRPMRVPRISDGVLLDRKYLQSADYVDASLIPWLNGRDTRDLPPVRSRAMLSAAWGDAVGWAMDERPRVSVDRAASSSDVYMAASASFHGMGLAVHVAAQSAGDLTEVDTLFKLLGYTGIGGERSIGFGQFTYERRPPALPVTAAPAGTLLSLLWPTPPQIEAGVLALGDDTGYGLRDRTGWISSPVWQTHRARTVAMLAAGSYANPAMPGPLGGMADVTPRVPLEGRHRVYRYGYGLFLDEAAA